MSGRLIVIDGLDASGKETQTALLAEHLGSIGKAPLRVEFPDYKSDSSALIRMYLAGEFGKDPSGVNPYAASTFYAVDRFASYTRRWREHYESGGLVVADRYTTSNAIHQGVKLTDGERAAYLDWLWDYEYRLLALPKPDMVLFLDMPPRYALRLLAGRYAGDEGKKDIHERNAAYLSQCYDWALRVAELCGWVRIACVEGDAVRPPSEIAAEITKTVEGKLSGLC